MRVSYRIWETPVYLAGCLLLLFMGIRPADAQETPVYAVKDTLLVSMILPPTLRPEIIESLDSGLRSQITFEIKVYRRTSGLRSIFGDQLIREEQVTYEGKLDNFNDSYLIYSNPGILTFENPQDFLEQYFSLHEYPLSFHPEPGHDYYLLTRILVEETKLVPPLNLLVLFMPKNRTLTEWRRQEIVITRESPG